MAIDKLQEAEYILQSYTAFTRMVNCHRICVAGIVHSILRDTAASIKERQEKEELDEHHRRLTYLKEGREDLFKLSLDTTWAKIKEFNNAAQFIDHQNSNL